MDVNEVYPIVRAASGLAAYFGLTLDATKPEDALRIATAVQKSRLFTISEQTKNYEHWLTVSHYQGGKPIVLSRSTPTGRSLGTSIYDHAEALAFVNLAISAHLSRHKPRAATPTPESWSKALPDYPSTGHIDDWYHFYCASFSISQYELDQGVRAGQLFCARHGRAYKVLAARDASQANKVLVRLEGVPAFVPMDVTELVIFNKDSMFLPHGAADPLQVLQAHLDKGPGWEIESARFPENTEGETVELTFNVFTADALAGRPVRVACTERAAAQCLIDHFRGRRVNEDFNAFLHTQAIAPLVLL